LIGQVLAPSRGHSTLPCRCPGRETPLPVWVRGFQLSVKTPFMSVKRTCSAVSVDMVKFGQTQTRCFRSFGSGFAGVEDQRRRLCAVEVEVAAHRRRRVVSERIAVALQQVDRNRADYGAAAASSHRPRPGFQVSGEFCRSSRCKGPPLRRVRISAALRQLPSWRFR